MRDRPKPLAGLIILLSACVLAGCQSLQRGVPPDRLDQSEFVEDTLSEEDRNFALGLARYAQGLIYDYERNPDAALTNYLAAIDLDSSNDELTFRIAMGLLQQHRSDEAVAIMESLVDRAPGDPKPLAWLAVVYRLAERADDARRTYERLIDTDHEAADAYVEYADFLYGMKAFEDAAKILERGTRHAKEPVRVYHALGRFHRERMTATSNEVAAAHHRAQAIDAYASGMREDSDNLEIQQELGGLYILDDDLDNALKLFRRIEKRLANDMATRRSHALSFVTTEDPLDAIAALLAIQADPPDGPQIPYYLGELYHVADDREKSAASFHAATEVTRKDPIPFIRLALVHLDENPEEALATLKRGLVRMPKHPQLTEMIAYAYLNLEKAEESLPWFATAEERLGEKAAGRFFYSYGMAAYLAGEPDTAIRCLSRAMDVNVIMLQLFMRDLLADEDPDLEAIIVFFERFAEAAPESPVVQVNLGILKSYDEQYEEAVTHFARALDLAHTHSRSTQIIDDNFYFAYAAAQERTGNYEQAETSFYLALELNPDHANAHNYLAYMWAERGLNLDRAMEHVTTALEIAPDSGAFLDTLGWIHYMKGDYEQALQDIQRANVQEPDDHTIIEHLGDTLAKLDRTDEAIEHWNRALALDPGNQAIIEKLAGLGAGPEPPEGEDSQPPQDSPDER